MRIYKKYLVTDRNRCQVLELWIQTREYAIIHDDVKIRRPPAISHYGLERYVSPAVFPVEGNAFDGSGIVDERLLKKRAGTAKGDVFQYSSIKIHKFHLQRPQLQRLRCVWLNYTALKIMHLMFISLSSMVGAVFAVYQGLCRNIKFWFHREMAMTSFASSNSTVETAIILLFEKKLTNLVAKLLPNN